MSSFLSLRSCTVGFGATALALTLAACTTVNVPPAGEAPRTGPNAPVVESSVNSAGQPVAAPLAPEPAYAPPPAAGTAAPLAGLHLQAGVFSSQASAESVASHIRSKVPSMAQRVAVQPRGTMYRVVIGPFASDAERTQAAGQIRTQAGSEVANAAP